MGSDIVKSQQELLDLVDAHANACTVWDSEDRLVAANRLAIGNLGGAQLEDVVGVSFSHFLPPGAKGLAVLLKSARQRVWKKGQYSFRFDVAGTTVDVTLHHLEWEGVSATLASWRELSSEALPPWTEMLVGARAIHYLVSADFTNPVYISPSCHSLLGYSVNDLISQPRLWRDIVEPEDLPDLTAALDRLRTEGEFGFRCRVRHASGARLWFEHRGRLRGDQVHGLALDVTREAQLEEELGRSHHAMAVLHQIQQRYISTGTGRTDFLEDVLQAMVQLLEARGGSLREEGETSSPLAITPGFDEADPSVKFYSLTAAGKVVGSLALAHEPRLDLILILEPFLSVCSSMILGIRHDRARAALQRGLDENVQLLRKQAQELEQARDSLHQSYGELQRNEEMRQLLTNMLVHDLRTPLTGIVGNARLMAQRAEAKFDATESKLLHRIIHQSKDLTEMVSSILDVSRLEGGQLPLELSPVELIGLAREVIADLTPDRTVYLESPERLEVVCDGPLMTRVLGNLVSNALRYSPTPTPIAVQITGTQREAEIRVKDQGPGIDPELHDVIFEKFAQVNSANPHSTGLGLTFCKLVVEKHGGQIGVESDLGKGSVFWVRLPL